MMKELWLIQTALTVGRPAAMEGLSLFRAVLTVGAVLVLAWWCSRLLGKQWVKSSGFGGNICLIEQIQVGQNQKILLLKAGEEYILVGVSPAGIQFLSKVEGDFQAAVPPQPSAGTGASFGELLRERLESWQEKRGGKS